MTQAFNLSQLANKVNTSGQLDASTGLTGQVPVANGGTAQSTYTNGQLLIGNSTGNTLTKNTITAGANISVTNGAGSITISSVAGQVQTQLFTAPGTWTCPSATTQVKVTVIGGGGAGNGPTGIPGTPGTTSTFGSFVSATGGVYSNPTTQGTSGTGTVSTGTSLKTGDIRLNIYSATLAQTFSPVAFYNVITGYTINASSAPATTYSTTSLYCAGAAGNTITPASVVGFGGAGGLAIAIVPVSAPVSVTVGTGGTKNPSGTSSGGIGGAVLVEWTS
jgi:hypothetical protein